MQNHYNLLYREEEREMIPTLKVSNRFISRRSGLIVPSISVLALSHGPHLEGVY